MQARYHGSLHPGGGVRGNVSRFNSSKANVVQSAELNATELQSLARIVESSLRVRKRHHFFLWVQGEVQGLLPHEILICGMADGLSAAMRFHLFASCRHFSDGHFEAVCKPGSGLLPRMMEAWGRHGRPRLASPGGDCELAWAEAIERHELCNVAAHGVIGANGRVSSYFSFSRLPGAPTPRHAHLLELIVPHLHVTLARVLHGAPDGDAGSPAGAVTGRERDILHKLSQGKTNIEIAELLCISPLTVKNHVHRILKKLGVKSRGHAVVKALELDLLKPETQGEHP
jgi:transcriptional regulator EpsA